MAASRAPPGLINMNKATVLAVALFLTTKPATAFFRNTMIGRLADARMDPIVSPGAVSQHCHHLNGGSGMSFNSTGQSLLTSNCTNSVITQDNSNYWAPWMYFQFENGSFTQVELAMGLTAYYKYEVRPSAPANVSYAVFPQNFRMISGTSMKRSFNSTWPTPPMAFWGPQDLTQSSLAEKALGFNCLHYYTGTDEASFAYPYLRNKSFIDTTCVDGIRAEVLFPSCWDGVNLDSEDHKSHVAFPTQMQGGICPSTHPVYLPILFYETIWNTQQFNETPGQFVFANGDPTGYGYHGDFMAAWPEGFQEEVRSNAACTGPNSQGQVQDCPLFHLQSQEDANECKLVLPDAIEHEQTGAILSKLPGNNPITGAQCAPNQCGSDNSSNSESAAPTSGTAGSTPSMTRAPVTTNPSAASTSTEGLVSTTTTTYTSAGLVVEMVLIEDIDIITVTVPHAAQTSLVSNGTTPTCTAHPSPQLGSERMQRHVRHLQKHKSHQHNNHHL